MNAQQFTRFVFSNAPHFGLDPRAVLGIAHHESGLNVRAVGDQGTSFGPFQLHEGGALPSGRGLNWASSTPGILYALRQMSSSARGLHGQAAVSAISRGFERPADPAAEIADAMRAYGSFGGGGGLAGTGGAGSVGPAAATHPARQGLLQTIMANNESFATTGVLKDPLTMHSILQNGLTNRDQSAMGNIKPGPGMMLSGKAGSAVNAAKQFLGVPYVWGGTSSRGLDCSGLVQLAYAKIGVHLPRTTYDQIKVGTPVKWGSFRPGDLIFSNFEGPGAGASHVVMYIGNGKVIAAPHTGENVQIESVGVFKNYFVGARRVVH